MYNKVYKNVKISSKIEESFQSIYDISTRIIVLGIIQLGKTAVNQVQIQKNSQTTNNRFKIITFHRGFHPNTRTYVLICTRTSALTEITTITS